MRSTPLSLRNRSHTSIPRPPRRRPLLEALEERCLLASFHWVNNASGAFNVAANWQDQNGNPGVPGSGDDATIYFNGITVGVPGSTSLKSLNTAGGATLNITGGTFAITSTSQIGRVNLSTGTTFQVAGGTTTLIGGGTIAGGFDVVPGATLAFDGSTTFDLNSGAALTGTGLYDITSAYAVLSVNAPLTAPQSFEQDGGTMTGPATLTVPGTFTWAGGFMTGTGSTTIAPSGTLAITGAGPKYMVGRTLNNAGVTTDTGIGSLGIGNASFNNLAGGTFNLNAAALFYDYSGKGVVNNAGTLNVNPGASATATIANQSFNNTGTVNVETGTLLIQTGGTSSGVFDVAAGAVLDFGGVSTIVTGAVFQGAGLYAASDEAANLTLNTDVTVSRFDLTAGQISGPGNLTVTDTLNWTGQSTMTGPGTTTIPFGASLAIAGSSVKSLVGRTINNGGLTTFTGLGPVNVFDGVFNNLAGGAFNFNTAASFGNAAGTAVLNNSGTLNIDPGAGATATISTPTFTNTGRINLNSGTLLLPVNGTDSGSVVAAPGAALMFGSTLITTGFTIEPTATFQGGAGSTVGLTGDFATVALDANWTVDHFVMAGGDYGGLSGSGTLTVTGEADWSVGNISGTGTAALNIAPGALLKISGTGGKSLATGRALNNAGTATWTDNGSINAGFPFVINNTGTFAILGNSSLGHNADAIFNNSGTLTVDPGSGLVNWTSLTLNNTGTVDVRSGRFNVDTVSQVSVTKLTGGTWSVGANSVLSFNFNGGPKLTENDADVTLGGPGASFPALNTLAINAGSLTLGAGASLSVPGTFTQTAAGTLTVVLGGSPASGLAGVLHAATGATLGGTLALGLAGGFAPASGDQFKVVTYPNVAGAFAQVVRLSPGPGQSLGAQVTPTAVVVSGTGSAKPADLTVQSVTVTQTTGQPGDPATLTWTVLDRGGPALGPWEDALYLSPTPTLGPGAVLLAVVPHADDVAAGQTYTASAAVALPGLPPGNYYAIVRVDRRDRGPNTADETAASTQPFALLPVPTLTPGTPVNGLFTGPNLDRYFQITVSPGQSLRLDALSAAGTGTLEVSARLDALPTPGQSDATTAGNFGPGQVLTVPPSQGGTYFVDVHSRSGAVDSSAFRITATLPGLSLLSASPGSVGNGGPITLAVHGTGLTPDTRFSLSGPSGSVAGGVERFVDGTLAYVTFDLTGRPAGQYALTATPPGASPVTLAAALSVTSNLPDGFDVQVSGPAEVRPDRTYSFVVTYRNTGNTDLPAPLLQIVSDNKTPLGLAPDLIDPNGSSLQVLAISPDGPAGTLRPGQSGSVTVFFTPGAADPSFTVSANTVHDPAPVDYARLALTLKAPSIPQAQWDAIFANFESRVGPTAGDYVRMLDRNATLFPAGAGDNRDPFNLAEQEIVISRAAVGTSVSGVVRSTDPLASLGGRTVLLTNSPITSSSTADPSTFVGFSATTLADGSFSVLDVAPGTYFLFVDGAILPNSPTVTVASGQAVKGVTLDLVTGGVLAGRVTAVATGLPAAGASVEAVAADGTPYPTVTGPAGLYRLTGLPTGAYTLIVQADGLARAVVPNVAVSGTPAAQDVSLVPGATLTGTLALEAGGPTGGRVSVWATPTGSTDPNATVFGTVQGTRLTIPGLPAGTYDLTVVLDGYVTQTIPGVSLGAGAALDVGTVALARSASVSGTVASTDPQTPAAFARVLALSGTIFVGATIADASGAFLLDGLPPGTYTLSVSTTTGVVTAPTENLAAGAAVTGVPLAVSPGTVTPMLRTTAGPTHGVHASALVNTYLDELGYAKIRIEDLFKAFQDFSKELKDLQDPLPTTAPCPKCQGDLNKAVDLISDDLAFVDGLLDGAEKILDDIASASNPNLSVVAVKEVYFDRIIPQTINGESALKKIVPGLLDNASKAVLAYDLCKNDCNDPKTPSPATGSGGNNGIGFGFISPYPSFRYQPKPRRSHDPNEKTGPGFGPQGFVAAGAPLAYSVQFENDPAKATAAAQEVVVTDKLDPKLDWTTFALGDITFGSQVVAVPAGLQSYSTSVSTTNTDGTALRVDVSAGLDLSTGVVTWTFRSIDPATGQLPTGVQDGFLPVDDATGRGLGSVFFTVLPNLGLSTGATFSNTATIVFDTNAPIATATVAETIDAGAPTSSVAPLPAASAPRFTVRWSGTDDPGGSGIATFNVFVSTDGGPYTVFLLGTAATSAPFDGVVGHRYAFSTIAVDHVGNVQPTLSAPSVTTVSNSSQAPTITLAPPGPFVAGTALSVGGSFSSPNAGPFVVAANYGDGTGLQRLPVGPGRTFSLSHTYARPGTYTVTVGVKDGSGVVGSETLRLTVLASLPGSGFGAGRDAFVTTLYKEDLRRLPEAGGLKFWSGKLASGVKPKTIALAIYTSPEHRALVRQHLAPAIPFDRTYADALLAGQRAALQFGHHPLGTLRVAALSKQTIRRG